MEIGQHLSDAIIMGTLFISMAAVICVMVLSSAISGMHKKDKPPVSNMGYCTFKTTTKKDGNENE